MIPSVTIPIAQISIILYICLTFFGNHTQVWIFSLLLGLIFSLLLSSKNFAADITDLKKLFSLKYALHLTVIALFLITKAVVISPLIVTKSTDNFTHIQTTPVGDYYKHTFVVNSLVLDGIPPQNPYFPASKLSYYFGFYLIPASISKIFHILPNQSLFFWTLLTDFISLLILFRIFNKLLKNYWLQLAALLLLITGLSIDSIPIITSKSNLLSAFLSPDVFDRGKGLQLINNYVAFLYVPQHFFAAALTVGFVYSFLREKVTLAHSAILSSYIFLLSLFITMTFSFWLFLLFIFHPAKRSFFVKTGLLTLLILSPYFWQLSARENILYFYQFEPFQFISKYHHYTNYILNTALTVLLSYGPIIIAGTVLLKNMRLTRQNLLISSGLITPIIATWFIRSPIFNDFGMRTLMPIQLILPALLLYPLELKIKNAQKLFLSALSILAITIGLAGFFLEYSWHWKAREFLDPKDSELIFAIRKLPENIALSAIEKSRWVELTPSLAFKKILSPFLFDSYIYFVGSLGIEHGTYERQALNIFIEANTDKDIENLTRKTNVQMESIYSFFSKYQADKVIISNKVWVKQDINPWLFVFQSLGVKEIKLTPYYTLFDRPNLLLKLSTHHIQIGNIPEKINTQGNKFYLTKNLWFIAHCSETPKHIKLEFEDYYLLFDQKTDGQKTRCVGKIFYMPQNGNIQLSNTSTVNWVYISPIKITEI